MQETWVWSLGWEDPLEKGMATHSCIRAWRIPWTEESGGLQSMELQRVRYDWATQQEQQWHQLWGQISNFPDCLINTLGFSSFPRKGSFIGFIRGAHLEPPILGWLSVPSPGPYLVGSFLPGCPSRPSAGSPASCYSSVRSLCKEEPVRPGAEGRGMKRWIWNQRKSLLYAALK